MYDDLGRELRESAEWAENSPDFVVPTIVLHTMRKAADAIEELQQTAKHYKGCSDDWYKEACDYKAMLPRWIPVTERLPEKECPVLAYYGFNRGDGHLGMMFMQVMDYYTDDPRPHFQHEGLNGLTVTHWMPLPTAPEPPKEEA